MSEQLKGERFLELQETVRKLHALLEDSQPGLVSWHSLVHDRLVELRLFCLTDTEQAAPDLLAACEAGTTIRKRYVDAGRLDPGSPLAGALNDFNTLANAAIAKANP